MAHSIIMPKAEMAMEEGVIVRWLAAEGDPVGKGHPVLEIETDKSTLEVEADIDGVLLRILHPEGARVPVTDVVGWIGEPGEEVPDPPRPTPAMDSPGPVVPSASTLPPCNSSPTRGRVAATPAARRLARERGIDPASLPVSGDGRPLRAADIPPSPTAAPAAGDIEIPLTRIQRTSARRLAEAHDKIPAVTLHARADVTALSATREQLAEAGDRVTYNDFVLAATARTLLAVPELNAEFHDDRVVRWGRIDLAFAVATENGLLVPVLRNADQPAVPDLAARARALTDRARAGQLGPEDLEGGTFTVTNVGKFGITGFSPIINLPQVAILGVCAVGLEPRIIEDRVVARAMMGLSLTFDHRAMDGVPPSRFLQELCARLENPARLLEQPA